MFDDVDGGHRIGKDAYRRHESRLRVELQRAQYELREADFSVLVLLAGNDRIGVADTMRTLNEWMDPRSLRVHAFGQPTQEERERPEFWRYWRVLPARGSVAIFLGGWTVRALIDRLDGEIGRKTFERRLERVRRAERLLVDNGTLVLKFWLHVGRDELGRRLRKARRDPDEAWRVHERDWIEHETWRRALRAAKRAVSLTDTAKVRWRIVDSADRRYRTVTVARGLLDAVRGRLRSKPKPSVPTRMKRTSRRGPAPLDTVDLSSSLAPERYEKRLDRWRARLHGLTHDALDRGISSVLVFEGWDASGKGGVIRRLSAALDPPSYRVVPVAAPTEEELAHDYLWRFSRHLPRAGHVTLFDRSWYGRVLVERVEGLTPEAAWRRAYDEINGFEEMLVDHGIVLIKFWLHIDKAEQLRRFRDRERTPFKKYKITADDWRNRRKWKAYEAAVNDMVERTGTRAAPWTLVPANDKHFARVHVVKTFCRRLRDRLK